MKLLSFPGDPQVSAALIAAEYCGVNVETPAFDVAASKSDKEFQAASPFGKIPLLLTPQGSLFDAGAILHYVASTNATADLTGRGFFETAAAEQWVNFAYNTLAPIANQWVYQVFEALPFNKGGLEKAKKDLAGALRHCDDYLLSRTFFVGEAVSTADIAMTAALLLPFTNVLDGAEQKKYPNLTRWFSTCVNQPQFAAVLGKVQLCTKAKEPQPPAGKAKAEKAPKAKAAPAPAAAAAEEEEEPKEEKPKAPHWSTQLPPSTMVMDEWKRCYSNNDTREVANPEFWKMYDPSGYSLWSCMYKYNEELEKVFMTCNLVGGWFQRLDRSRKFTFGNVMVFGGEGNMKIGGVFLFRGQQIPPEVTDCDDTELYEWKKLDHTDPATKTLVEDYWAWDGSFGGIGMEVNQGKTFK
mmetsp:Transcript_57332/g.134917  ORF Transcript_57332/g.134917 Transcript_57332/m.134917 type:complete len:411 (+) Transcript_57332:56-1288(+)